MTPSEEPDADDDMMPHAYMAPDAPDGDACQTCGQPPNAPIHDAAS